MQRQTSILRLHYNFPKTNITQCLRYIPKYQKVIANESCLHSFGYRRLFSFQTPRKFQTSSISLRSEEGQKKVPSFEKIQKKSESLFEIGEFSKAIQLLTNYEKEHGSTLTTKELDTLKEKLGDYYIVSGNGEEALSIYNSIEEKRFDIEIRKALTLYSMFHRFDDAKEVLESLDKLFELSNEQLAVKNEQLGRLYTSWSQKQKYEHEKYDMIEIAINYQTKAIQIDGEKSDYYFGRGIAHEKNHHYHEAIMDFTSAIEKEKQSINFFAHLHRADCLSRIGGHSKAIGDYDILLENFQSFVEEIMSTGHRENFEQLLVSIIMKRGICYIQIPDYELAISSFSKIIDNEDPAVRKFKAIAHNKRGVCYGKLGDLKKCIEDQTEAIQIDNKLAAAYRDRANTYQEMDMMEEAKKDREVFHKLQSSPQ